MYRQSRQRDMILNLLRSTDTHPTADWLYGQLKEKIPSLSLGTVYRNLHILAEQCLVQKIASGSTFDRFEANPDPHYHLICEICGKVEDFEMDLYQEINYKANRITNFKVDWHRIDFFGICPECKAKQKAKVKK
jgi:Fur family peroxide stress response transcriptional regulator